MSARSDTKIYHTSQIGVQNYTGLCLGVGGMKGLLQLGALHVFWDRGQLRNLSFYAGSSIGALIVSLLAIGYTPLELLTIACDPYFTSNFGVINFGNIPTLHGLFPHSILRNKLEELALLKLGYLPTFDDLLRRLGKHLIITAYCISDPDPEKSKVYFGPISHPNMPVIEAIILSCNIPGIFPRAKWDGKLWIDGACTCMFPIKVLQAISPPDCPILGLTIKNDPMDLDTLLGYVYAIASIPFREQNNFSDLKPSTEVLELDTMSSTSDLITTINFASGAKHNIEMFIYATKKVQTLLDSFDQARSE